jgi:cytochrome c oxidase subunit 2
MPEKDYVDWVTDQHRKSAATAAANAVAAGKTETLSELMTEGQKVYERNCVACHQANGQGLPPTFPALAHSKVATGPIAAHVDIVMNGSKKNPAMVAWKGQLSDAQIAAVITYERNAFGNSLGDLVQPQVIAAARQ